MNPNPPFPKIFWIRKDLFRSRVFSKDDCFPVKRLGRFDPVPTLFKISMEGVGPVSRSFAEVVKGNMDPRRQQQQRPPHRQPSKKAAPEQKDQPLPQQPPAPMAAKPVLNKGEGGPGRTKQVGVTLPSLLLWSL
ncbi:hypothetical protein D1007_15137 [Hordeum vulgare]|nr:hypothetical protein D1007_15137 [Hordeum vulgare]